MHCRKRRKEMQDRSGQRFKPLSDKGSGRGDGEAVQGCKLLCSTEGRRDGKGRRRRALVFRAAAVVWGPIRWRRCPSPLTGWQGGGRRSVTGLGNEPGEQPVGGDDGWMSNQVYSCDRHTLKHTHTQREERMQQREHREGCQ